MARHVAIFAVIVLFVWVGVEYIWSWTIGDYKPNLGKLIAECVLAVCCYAYGFSDGRN